MIEALENFIYRFKRKKRQKILERMKEGQEI